MAELKEARGTKNMLKKKKEEIIEQEQKINLFIINISSQAFHRDNYNSVNDFSIYVEKVK